MGKLENQAIGTMRFISFIQKNMQQPVTKNIGWQAVFSFFRMAFSLISAMLLTRHMGLEMYGQYSFILAVTGMLSVLIYGGTANVSVRYFKEEPEHKDQILCSVIAWRYICWIITSVFIFPAFLIADGARYDLILVIFLSFLFNPFDALDSYFQSQYENKYYIITRISVELIALSIKVFFIFADYDLHYFIYLIAAQNVFYALLILCVYRITNNKPIRVNFSKPLFVKIVRSSLPMILTTFLFVFYMRIDQVMISYLIGDKALGYFAPSTQIVMALTALGVIFTYPMQVKFKDIGLDHPEYEKWMGRYISSAFKISCLCALLVSSTAWFFIPILFGEDFSETASVLAIQVWSCVFSLQGSIRDLESVSHLDTKYNLICAVFGVLSNIILNLVLIPLYGIHGAAIATILSLFVSGHLVNWFVKDLRIYAVLQRKAFFFS
ncbi:MAG: flippase [Bacteroidota bacterium]